MPAVRRKADRMSLTEATPAVAEPEKPAVQSGCPDVRLARPEDRAAILDLCFRLGEENAVFPIAREKVEALVDKALSRETGALMGVSTKDDILCGCICLDMVSMWYSSVAFITDIFNYLSPEYRKTNLARQQLRFAKMVADQFGLPLFVAIMTTIRTETKMNLYAAEKFTQVGGQFVYIPQPIRHLFKESWQIGA